MTTNKDSLKNKVSGSIGEAEVISILPYIQKKTVEPEETNNQLDSLGDFLTLTELSTDDIAGTLIARHVYEVDLLPEINSKLLIEELTMRLKAHQELLDQIKDNV